MVPLGSLKLHSTHFLQEIFNDEIMRIPNTIFIEVMIYWWLVVPPVPVVQHEQKKAWNLTISAFEVLPIPTKQNRESPRLAWALKLYSLSGLKLVVSESKNKI